MATNSQSNGDKHTDLYNQPGPSCSMASLSPIRPSPLSKIMPSTSSQTAVPVEFPVMVPPITGPVMVPPIAGTPWKCPEWMTNENYGLIEFNGTTRMPFKRKLQDDMETPIITKQKITEEKMAAHFDGLHISSQYTSHQADSSQSLMDALNESSSSSSSSSSWSSSPTSPYTTLATIDLEEKLRRAQRITLCEEIRKLSVDNILPQSILARMDKPCTALVIWQPPQNISNLIIPKDLEMQRKHDDEEQDNNNSSSFDLNNTDLMDVEM